MDRMARMVTNMALWLAHPNYRRNRRILQKGSWTEVIEFRENFVHVWLRVNTCEVVCEEDLKHFHTSLLGNEEDAKGLLNIKQEVLSHYLLHLI